MSIHQRREQSPPALYGMSFAQSICRAGASPTARHHVDCPPHTIAAGVWPRVLDPQHTGLTSTLIAEWEKGEEAGGRQSSFPILGTVPGRV